MQLESRRRDAKKKRISLHAEVERAVHSAMDAGDEPLDALKAIPGMASEEIREVNRSAAAASSDDPSSAAAAAASSTTATGISILSACAGIAWQTLNVSKDIAVNLYYSKDPMRGALDGSTSSGANAAPERKKEQ